MQAVLYVYTLAEFIDTDWGDKSSNSGIWFSYWPAGLHGTAPTAGRYDNPMPELTLSASQGSMNLATGLAPLQDDDRLEDRHPEFKTSCPAHHANLSFPVYLIIIRNKHTTTQHKLDTPHLIIIRNKHTTTQHTSQILHTSS